MLFLLNAYMSWKIQMLTWESQEVWGLPECVPERKSAESAITYKLQASKEWPLHIPTKNI